MKIKIKILNILLLILCISIIDKNIYSNAINFASLKDLFECPFGWDPIFESNELNGQPETKVTFKTQTPFDDIKRYYIEYLSNTHWKFIDYHQISPFPFDYFKGTNELGPIPDQLVFINNNNNIIIISYISFNKESMLSFSLLEGIPILKLNSEKLNLSHINNIHFDNSTPVFTYHSKLLNGLESCLYFFHTDSSPDYIIDYYKMHLKNNKWKHFDIFDEFKEGIKDIIGNIYNLDMLFNNFLLFQKNEDILFFFTKKDNDINKTLFGYFIKKIDTSNISNPNEINIQKNIEQKLNEKICKK